MSESRWSRWVDHSPKKLGFSSFIKEAKTGVNPTGTGIETPAQRAERMGLQSDGHGSYMDPNTGQVVARTINNELVFYDNGPTGGAVSDGEGGDYKPQSGATGPTFTDPDTGMVMVPPAQPKSKEELAAVPDHTPATAPTGFKDAMVKKKEKGQRKNDLAARLTAAANKNQPAAEEDPLGTIEGRRDAVDADIASGMDAAAAHEKTHGHDPSDKESNASLAATMGRLTKDNGVASINTDEGSESLLAKDQAGGEIESTDAEQPAEREIKGRTLDQFMDAQKAATPDPSPKDKAEARAGGTSAGAGTVHELALLDAMGGELSEVDQEKLMKNLDISGENGRKAYEIARKNAADLNKELQVRGVTDVDDIIWTAQLRGEGLAAATGIPGLSDKNNQSDIIVKGKDANGNPVQYGVSLKVATSKSTKYPNDIPFFNGGLGKEAARFGADGVVDDFKKETQAALKDLGITATGAANIKKEIRGNEETKKKADEAGRKIMANIRDKMVKSLEGKDVDQMRDLFSTMTGAPTGDGQKLQTLKLTGYANGPRTTKIEDSLNGTVPMAIRTAEDFQFEPVGDTSFRVMADGVPVMKVRFKWESQALGSSMKISGESP